MAFHARSWRRYALASVVCSAILLIGLGAGADPGKDPFAPVKGKLLRDGVTPEQLAKAYPPDLTPLYRTVSLTMKIRESRLNYAQFLAPEEIARAQRFLATHQSIFAQAERRHGVDRHVIAAILLVETRLGTFTGETPTLAVLSTFALMNRKHHRDRVWSQLRLKDRKRLRRSAFDRKLAGRAGWAYDQLLALFAWQGSRPEYLPVIRGSVMGAVGWSQFIPTSVIRHGYDGNRDGRVDLFDPADAIHSISNYLRAHGWTSAATQTQQERVIWHYNRSRPYVRTVLEIARRLARQSRVPSPSNPVRRTN